MSNGKLKKQKSHHLQQENSGLMKRNKELGDQNEKLKSKVKALEAEKNADKAVIEELSKSNAVTIIEQPEDNSLKAIEKLFAMTQDDRVHKQLTEEERTQTALRLRKQFLDQDLEAQRAQQELRLSSPEVIDARTTAKARRNTFYISLGLGCILVIVGIMLLASLYWLFSLPVMYIGSGLTSVGVLFALIGIVPYFSPEDTDRLERLYKVFQQVLPNSKGQQQGGSDQGEEEESGAD